MTNRNKEICWDKREFLIKTGMAATGLTATLVGCATFDPHTAKESKEFDIKAFDKWYRQKKLYNGPNLNLKRPHYYTDTFLTSIQNSFSPGAEGYQIQTQQSLQ